ncbi:hypothetical protein L1987_22082 [Smallanthus sonchifolius]|uniref:Uncharacterized protein n=1 Tax=Smallanthus sonchifolius TaxID=185202 RepID=A0ACB9IFC8_9ASTR|nr:hypothetical protein L1987_22082 [Smallanthus sonchifolius]
MAFSHHYLLIFALCTRYAESADPIAQYCNEFSNTTTPEMTKNIDSVLTKLVQNTPQTGFNLTEFKTEGTTLLGLAQCRGDVPSENCSTCLQTAAKEIRKMCPNRVDARLWYEYCYIRYDTTNFIGDFDMDLRVVYYNVEEVTDPKTFKKTLLEFVKPLGKVALEPDSKGFAKGEIKLSDSVTLYALFQCTFDPSKYFCEVCIEAAKEGFRYICENKKGCRVIYSNCYSRYELYPFFFPN